MNLISKLLQAARKRRHIEGGRKMRRRPAIAVELLDHRQLLSVNFTGNVATDFPATNQPGVVVINSSNTEVEPPPFPTMPPAYAVPLENAIQVSGFDLSEIRVSYDQADDTLSIGLNQPTNPKNPSTTVIAGDADNNGNSGVVGTVVSNLTTLFGQNFQEWPGLGGPQVMAAFLSLSPADIASMTPEVVAGFPKMSPPTADTPPKEYEVAEVINGMPGEAPLFDKTNPVYPINAGNVYLVNSSAHPNLEFDIKNFSLLYQAVTGTALTPQSEIAIGAFAGSTADGGIGPSFIREFAFPLSQATVPPSTTSPYILINPHEHRIIDTLHRDLVRVTVFGTSGFDVTHINPTSVELDGVHAIAHINRKVRRDEFLNATYVFPANDLSQPAGLYPATLTGATYSGVPFESSKAVLNIPFSARLFGRLHRYMGGGTIYKALAKAEIRNPSIPISLGSSPVTAVSLNRAPRGTASIAVNYTPAVSSTARAEKTAVRPMVSVPRLVAHEPENVPRRLRHSLNDYLS
jgi:hypothetical protein